MNAQYFYYPLSALINMLTSLFLGVLVFRTDKQNKLYQVYSLFCLSVACWSLFYFLWQVQSAYDRALFYSKLLMFGAMFIPFLYFHYVAIFLNVYKELKKIVWFGYFLALPSLAICFTSSFVRDVVGVPGFKYWPVAGNLFLPFLSIWFAYVIGGVVLIYRSYQASEGNKRNQLKYVLLATIVGWVGGATNYPLWFGIEVPPIGNFLVAVYISIVAYAIVKHQLMDIEVVIRRTAVFTGLFVFVYGIFSLVSVAGQEIFKNTLGWNQWLTTVPTVFIITFALRPLDAFLTNATEKYLFQKKYDYRDLLKTFTNEVLTVLDLQQLPDQTVAGLIRILKLESASVFLHRKDKKIFELVSSIGVKESGIVFDESHTLISYLRASGEYILKDSTVEQMETGELKETFKRLNAQLCLPISMHEDLIGVLCLGMKKSGEDFTQEDIDILSTLARTEAIAIANAQLFDELSKTQAEAAQREKMAVIGTLAAGINHEICNPLGIVRGQCEMFLLNSRDGFYKDKNVDEILKISSDVMAKVIKETDRATSITKKLSGFAKPSKRSELEEVAVERETDEVLGLIGHELTLSNIDIQKDFPRDFPIILGDRKQIQEVLFNIIRNAAQAMEEKNHGRIMISGFVDNGSVVVRVADNGSGIPQEKINQIFNPFYTTKAPGKGTGLGLFIVKQVVEKNKGSITVESQVGVGTTFALRFPTAMKTVMAS